jgi:hypothetical protein
LVSFPTGFWQNDYENGKTIIKRHLSGKTITAKRVIKSSGNDSLQEMELDRTQGRA